MANLYDMACVIMPNGNHVPIQALIDAVTMKAFTPQKAQWVDLMLRAQLQADNAVDAVVIKPGMSDYVIRQIVYYALDAMMYDAEVKSSM